MRSDTASAAVLRGLGPVTNAAGGDIWLAGGNLKPEKVLAAEMERRYAPRKGQRAR